MSGVVCAVRGGPHSQPTIRKAIELAGKNDHQLHFLYIVNLDFLTYTESSRVRFVTHELEQMGDFILLAAADQAQKAGVEAVTEIRHGSVGEEIVTYSLEIEASYIVLGMPQGSEEEDVFTQERLRALEERIEQESGADVIFAGGEGE
jgi:nucleotide-binding universal stress UspA family protein